MGWFIPRRYGVWIFGWERYRTRLLYLCRKVIRPLVKSYGDNSKVTLSPARTRMRLRRKRPARCARTTRSCSSCTLKSPLGNFSNTVPVTSMLSSLLINLQSEMGGPAMVPAGTDRRPAHFTLEVYEQRGQHR